MKVTRGSGAAVIDGRGQAKLVPAHTNPAHTRTQPPDTSSTIALTALTPRQSPSLAPAWLKCRDGYDKEKKRHRTPGTSTPLFNELLLRHMPGPFWACPSGPHPPPPAASSSRPTRAAD